MISRGSLTHFPTMIITLRPSLIYVFFSFLSFLRSTLSFTSFLSFLLFLSSATPTAPVTRVTLTMMMAIRRGKIQETVPPLVCSSSPTCVFLHTRLPSVDHSSTYLGTSACQQVMLMMSTSKTKTISGHSGVFVVLVYLSSKVICLFELLRWICLPTYLLSCSGHKYTHSYFYEHKEHYPVFPCLCSILLTKKEDSVRESKSPQGQRRGLCPMSVPLTTFLLRM